MFCCFTFLNNVDTHCACGKETMNEWRLKHLSCSDRYLHIYRCKIIAVYSVNSLNILPTYSYDVWNDILIFQKYEKLMDYIIINTSKIDEARVTRENFCVKWFTGVREWIILPRIGYCLHKIPHVVAKITHKVAN